MTPNRVDSERRLEAPHPGPLIKGEYVDALGLSVEEIAAHVGLEVASLAAMFAGTRSIDVDAAIRISRALQLPAERIMQMQVRRDFADARDDEEENAIDAFVPRDLPAFPDVFVRGRLARASEALGDDSFYFQETLGGPVVDDAYAGFHALWRGDRLRIYDAEGKAIWASMVLTDLDGRVLLPYAQTAVWLAWFDERRAADLHFGPDHAAFFERMHANEERPGGSVPERLTRRSRC